VSQLLYAQSLELSLLTPVLVESFINMAILMLCKRSIRENVRQFDAFIRSNIDVKVLISLTNAMGSSGRWTEIHPSSGISRR